MFAAWPQLKRHVREHADDKPHRCDTCGQSYNVAANLRLHRALHRTAGDVTTPECPECGKRFARLASLKAHLMLHEQDESLICSECGDEFTLQVRGQRGRDVN